MVRTQIQLTERQSRSLRAMAVRNGVSISELIRQGVDIVITNDSTPAWDEQVERAISAAGKHRSDGQGTSCRL